MTRAYWEYQIVELSNCIVESPHLWDFIVSELATGWKNANHTWSRKWNKPDARIVNEIYPTRFQFPLFLD